jgi:NADP-dependent 3-hydroxy acid dehydrogenase YdfG
MLAAEGRVVMVSGASRGIGRAVVDRLLASGFTVSAGMRTPDKLAGAERLMAHRYDAEEAGSAEAWVAATVERFGHVDAVVNAAGLNPKVRIQDEGEDLLDEMWRVNVKGPLRVIRAALPHLAKCGHGRVVNLGSLAGKRVGSNVGYAMTKFAVVALTHGVRREGRDAGIRATVICPGYVATDMTANETEIPRHEMSQPGDLAELVETVLRLPNNASVSELLVHCQFEPML